MKYETIIILRRILGFSFLIPFGYMFLTGKPFYSAIMCAIISLLFWAVAYVQKKTGAYPADHDKWILSGSNEFSLMDKVKQHLMVEHVNVKIRKKPLKNSGFGGFAMPILPFFVSIGYSDKIDKTEAMIHELVHDHYFIYGWQTMCLYIDMVFLLVAYAFRTPFFVIFSMAMMVGFMVIQEIMTFKKTRRVASMFGITTRDMSWNILVKYMVYYTIWTIFIFLIIFYVKGFWIGIAILVTGIYLLNKIFYHFGVWFNSVFPDKKNLGLVK